MKTNNATVLQSIPGGAGTKKYPSLDQIEEELNQEELLEIHKEMLETIENVDTYSWNRGQLGGLDWGIPAFNSAFDGLQPGLIIVAGQPNVGKSALCMNMALTIAKNNQEIVEGIKPHKAYVLYFSLDDNATELLPRFVAIDQRIPINAVKSPKKYETNTLYMEKRTQGIKNLKNMLKYFKIIDSTHGTSIEFIEEQIQRHKMQLEMEDPSYKIVAMVDNFHDITVDNQNFRSGNDRYDHIAGELSRISTAQDIPFICTAEFRKLNGNRRPTNDDVRETVKISYEAKAILLCYNEVGTRGDAATVFWNGTEGKDVKLPIFEVKVGKNKFSSYKNRLLFEFIPEQSYMNPMPEERAKTYNQMIIS